MIVTIRDSRAYIASGVGGGSRLDGMSRRGSQLAWDGSAHQLGALGVREGRVRVERWMGIRCCCVSLYELTTSFVVGEMFGCNIGDAGHERDILVGWFLEVGW